MDFSNLSVSGVIGVGVAVVFLVAVRMLYPRLSGAELEEGRAKCAACGWLGPPHQTLTKCGQCGADIAAG